MEDDYCCMCLSGERRRAAVSARHLQHMLLIYLDLKVVTSVCWECEARLSRLSAFRLQVAEAQRVLQQLPEGHSPLQSLRSLSTLAHHHKSTFDTYLVGEDNDSKRELLHSELDIDDNEIKLENDNHDYECDQYNHETAESNNEVEINALRKEDDNDYIDFGDHLHLLSAISVAHPVQHDRTQGPLDYEDDGGNDNELEAKGVDINNSYYAIQLSEAGLRAQRERLKADPKYTSAAHKCESCIFHFHAKERLDYHIENFHNRENRYECKVCKQRLATKILRRSHYKAHFHTYACNLCQYKNKSVYRIREHYSQKHKESYSCRICKLEFQSYKLLTAHKEDVHLDKKQCPDCGRQVPAKKYKVHVMQHNKKGPVKRECPICKKSFQRLHFHIKAHNKPKEGGVKGITKKVAAENWYCVECDRGFPTEARYLNHLAHSSAHAERQYECAHCGKKFYQKSTLRTHIQLSHMRQSRAWRCRYPDCQQVFSGRAELRAHLSARHAHAPPPRDKLCARCGKGFETNKLLKSHILTHTGERPHRCPQCDKGFTQKQCVTAHLLKAHGISPKVEGAVVPDAKRRFRCPDCGKGYVKNQNLKVHRWRLHGHPLHDYNI